MWLVLHFQMHRQSCTLGVMTCQNALVEKVKTRLKFELVHFGFQLLVWGQ